MHHSHDAAADHWQPMAAIAVARTAQFGLVAAGLVQQEHKQLAGLARHDLVPAFRAQVAGQINAWTQQGNLMILWRRGPSA